MWGLSLDPLELKSSFPKWRLLMLFYPLQVGLKKGQLRGLLTRKKSNSHTLLYHQEQMSYLRA